MGAAAVLNSQKSNNNCECFVEFLVRHTNDTHKTHTARERERERDSVGPAAHATSYWKRASQAKPAKQRREYDTKAKQQKCWHKERDA